MNYTLSKYFEDWHVIFLYVYLYYTISIKHRFVHNYVMRLFELFDHLKESDELSIINHLAC